MTQAGGTFGRRAALAADHPPAAGQPAMKRSTMIALGVGGLAAAAAVTAGLMGAAQPGAVREQPVVEAPAEPPASYAYQDHAECVAGGVLDAKQCDAALAEAADRHLAAAPRFEDQGVCEQEYGEGGCRMVSFDGSRVFIPAMAGFLAANAAMKAQQARAQQQPGAQPLYPPSQTQQQRCRQEAAAAPANGTVQPAGAQQPCEGKRYATSGGFIFAAIGGFGRSAPVAAAPASAFAPAGRQVSPVGPAAPARGMTSATETRRGGFGQTAQSRASSTGS